MQNPHKCTLDKFRADFKHEAPEQTHALCHSSNWQVGILLGLVTTVDQEFVVVFRLNNLSMVGNDFSMVGNDFW